MHRSARRAPSVAVAVLVVLAALTGCSSSNSFSKTSPKPSTSAKATTPQTDPGALPSGVVNPTGVPTRVANVVALRKNVTLAGCKATTTGWGATGTATNPATAAHTYTLTVFFTDAHATVIGFGSTQVAVAPGGTAHWTVASKFHPAPTTFCVLRGVS
jgi:hypothetical protein